MSLAVRYYTKSGNTKKLADAIADALGVNACPNWTWSRQRNTKVTYNITTVKHQIQTYPSFNLKEKEELMCSS